MQNFPNSAAPPPIPPGFGGRGVGGSYPPQPAEPQISPRMTDDYVGMQQQSLHRGHAHPSQASHMLAFSSRSRGALEPPPTQGNVHSGSNSNPYRKDAVDYYFSMGGKDRHRRGGMGYGGGFGYPNIDGHIPHQYRHAGSSATPSSALMSPYPVEYGSGAGSGGSTGAFSPSQQYNLNQTVPGPQIQQRQHGQPFPAVHQQHRSYTHAGHRMTPQYSHYSPQGGASAGSPGMYSPPPQRYLDGASNPGFDPKASSSPSVTSSTPAAANSVGPVESVLQNFHASNYPGYPLQSHSLHKQAALHHRNSQHVLGYDSPLKMAHRGPSPGSAYTKHHPASASSVAQTASQETTKSPMHSNAQQSQIHQNFSPISNPSPAASAVHSPTCSSSPSPLMGISEAHGTPSSHAPSHPSSSNARSSHGHVRLLQTTPQLSPTPNSNSSVSSCGSSGSHKAHNLSAAGGSSLLPVGRSKMGQGSGVKSREEGPFVYSASLLDKMQDAGLNSLNALSSQVANLPNTVQHMLLTDTVFSHKKKDGGQVQHHDQPQPQAVSRNASAASSTGKDGSVTRASDGLDVGGSSESKEDREEQFSEGEHGRARQMSGVSSGSEAAGYNQTQTRQISNVKTVACDSQSLEAVVTETKTKEAHIPSSSPSPSTPPVSSSPSSTSSSFPPVTAQNCVPETGLAHKDHRGVQIKRESEVAVEKTQKVGRQTQHDKQVGPKNGQDKENMLHLEYKTHSNRREDRDASKEQQNAGGVGVIVSPRSEESHTEQSKHPQGNCVEEKQLHSYLKESSSHNGEEGVDLSLYSSHHQKSNSGRSQNPSQSGSHKYSHPESTYGSDLSMKSRMRAGSVGVMETNPRYLSYQLSQTGYGPVHPKDAGSGVKASVKSGQGAGSKAQEENSQMQQFPSLLQEVLQGYNLDRRYVRPEQAFSAHHQVQQQFSTRHPFVVAESAQVHGESPAYSAGKPPNQKHVNESEFSADAVKSEISSAKMFYSAEKADGYSSQSHLPRAAESPQPPAKHINLSDFTLPRRKVPSNVPSPSSAVQELLLQEPEPLAGVASKSKAQKLSGSLLTSSERRSVIRDASPNQNSAPERDREGESERSQSGASVIQQPFSSPAAPRDLSKKDACEKHAIKMEATSKEAGADAAHLQAEHRGSDGVSEADVEYLSKPSPYRRGSADITPMPSHPMSTNPLSSLSRPHSYLHGVDLSVGSGGAFPGYQYGETRERSMMSHSGPHFSSHHPYHHLPPQPQATNKLQMYPHPRGPPHPPHDMSEWVKAMNRSSKEMMVQHGSSPGRHKGSQPEPRQRVIAPTNVPGDQLKTPSLHPQGAYYEMKMWDSAHSVREGARATEGDPYFRPQPQIPVVAHGPSQMVHAQSSVESEVIRGAPEQPKHPCPAPPSSSAKPPSDITSTQPPVQRHTKAGASGDTNPLMLRRRVRSFISPIPAKRLHQDSSQQRAATNSHHSPGAQSESSHHNEDDSSSSELPCPRLSSPLPGESTFTQPLSPSGGNAKVLSARKGRGLKLEAIVQKITPNIKKPAGYVDDESNHFSGFSHSEIPRFSDSQDHDLHFPRAVGGDDGYMDDSHSLNDIIPFRGVDDVGPLPTSTYPCDSSQTSQIKQQDFDFGLGAGVSSVSGDKEDFALLGPLPPPPPLPRPVQGSPPPSSSALSDIQHFTSTYQQLETRKGEQSAANLLRQKLQETGMGFDDYPGSDYYGTTSPHQGHMAGRHQLSSGRSSLSPQDSKPLDSVVPKGYFPSGKKKGRPVGSVNKQKRAQSQVQTQAQTQVQTLTAPPSAPPAPPTPTPAAASTPPISLTASSTSTPTEPAPEENASPLAPPILTQVVKVDVDCEDTQPETEVKPVRQRRRGPKYEDGPLGVEVQQRRRRRGPVMPPPRMAKCDSDAPSGAGGGFSTSRVFIDPSRKGLFIPHIHVEKKVPEIGAVCTIVNAEEDKMKGERSAVGGKAGGTDSLLMSALCSQLLRRDRESEKREADEVETTLQSGKALPSSGHVVSGPVITETNHSGRLLCCLCQKWANYKHLGDLYGPYYPAEYAAKLPKNQPQIRQCQATAGTNKPGPNSEVGANALVAMLEPQTQLFSNATTARDCAASISSDPTSFTNAIRSAFSAGKLLASTTPSPSPSITLKPPLTWDVNPEIMSLPELKREPDFDQQQPPKQPPDDAQQRPQHRKLTSHPRFKRRHKSSEASPRMVPSNSKASLPFQPPPPALDSLGPLAQLAQLPQMPMDPEELWVHEGCIVWTSGVYLVNGRLYGLQEALDGARETSCSYCEMVGSTLGCYSKGCTLRYHYLCAIEADCSLNEDNFSLRCPKHKVKKESLPRAFGPPSQCLWSSQREAERKEDEDRGCKEPELDDLQERVSGGVVRDVSSASVTK
ncbi:transcription factor 20 isoform X2 [Nothobranchius furzeri]|uniref:transcription factor 20 isoform X2 n=1 Tax=Nothobranchius furzeri TaxID=105023 RepID=UPI0039046DC2